MNDECKIEEINVNFDAQIDSTNQHDHKENQGEFQRGPEENRDHYIKPPIIDFADERFK